MYSNLKILTWKSVKGSKANSADPDLAPHNVASDQGLQCLLTGFSIKNRIKAIDTTPLNDKWTRPKYNNGRVYQYTMG